MGKNMLEVPQFSLAERDRRWTLVRDLMDKASLDCLVVWGTSAKWDAQMSSIRYLTQIGGNGEEGVLIFPREGDPAMFLWGPAMETSWRKSQEWIKDKDVTGRPKGRSWPSLIRGQLEQRGLLKGRIGIASGSLRERDIVPYGIYSNLMKELNQAQISNATDIFDAARLIKSPEEIRFLERAGEAGDAMTEALRTTALPGVKECEVFGEVVRAMIAKGGEYPTLLLWGCGSGPEATGPFAHPGRLIPTRPLQKGDVIIMEMHPKYGGYMTHQERTVFVGEPKKVYRDMYKTAQVGLRRGVEKLTTEFTVGEPILAMREAIRESGFSYREADLTGHGLESGDPPPNVAGVPTTPAECFQPFRMPDIKFAPGMVVMLNIDVSTTDWSTSAFLAETYLITEREPRQLTKFDLEPIITV